MNTIKDFIIDNTLINTDNYNDSYYNNSIRKDIDVTKYFNIDISSIENMIKKIPNIEYDIKDNKTIIIKTKMKLIDAYKLSNLIKKYIIKKKLIDFNHIMPQLKYFTNLNNDNDNNNNSNIRQLNNYLIYNKFNRIIDLNSIVDNENYNDKIVSYIDLTKGIIGNDIIFPFAPLNDEIDYTFEHSKTYFLRYTFLVFLI